MSLLRKLLVISKKAMMQQILCRRYRPVSKHRKGIPFLFSFIYYIFLVLSIYVGVVLTKEWGFGKIKSGKGLRETVRRFPRKGGDDGCMLHTRIYFNSAW